ncbi:hypothetical protein HC031_13945 [Planosporangium thailandense]|uniref:Transporter (Transmembrane protein) n=1 Tax=Planosporangium thailandense TaxID=765197 RepID=A0ABX0XZN6_9ACTN|nr:hypothetical protein [Planosporangium thailandense]
MYGGAAVTALASGPVQDALGDVARFVPRLILFLVILALGWLAARWLRAGASRLLQRVGFDRAVERGGLGRLLAKTSYDARSLVATLVYYAVLLFTLQLAFGIWGPNPVSTLIAGIVAWLPKAFVAIIIVVIAAAVASGVRNIVTGALGGLSYGRLLANVASAFIIGIGVIAALNQIEVATSVTTPVLIAILATLAGILIVGVGGGLVRPMQVRWETWLSRAELERLRVREQLRVAAEQREEAARREQEAREAAEREAREAAEREEAARREREAREAAEREEAARREREAREAAEREEAARREREAQEAAERQAAAEMQASAAAAADVTQASEALAAPAASEVPEQAAPVEPPRKRTSRPRTTARDRAGQAAQRAEAEAGTLPQAPPSDDPTIAISTSEVQALAGGAAGGTQDAEPTQPIALPVTGTADAAGTADATGTADAAGGADDPERTQVIPTAEVPQPEKPATPRRRRPQGGTQK